MNRQNFIAILEGTSRAADRLGLNVKALLLMGVQGFSDAELIVTAIYQDSPASYLSGMSHQHMSTLRSVKAGIHFISSIKLLSDVAKGRDLSHLLPGPVFYGQAYLDRLISEVNHAYSPHSPISHCSQAAGASHGTELVGYRTDTGCMTRNQLIAAACHNLGRLPTQDEFATWIEDHKGPERAIGKLFLNGNKNFNQFARLDGADHVRALQRNLQAYPRIPQVDPERVTRLMGDLLKLDEATNARPGLKAAIASIRSHAEISDSNIKLQEPIIRQQPAMDDFRL